MSAIRHIDDAERRTRLGVRHAIAPGHRVADVAAAVAAPVCLHATEQANVYLSAFARAEITRDAIDAALYDERSVVRQLAMRRTLFAFPRPLLPAVRGSASARIAQQLAARLAKEVEQAGIAAAGGGVRWLEAVCADVRASLDDAPATTAQLRERVPALAERIDMSPGKSYGGNFAIAPRVLSVLAADGSVVRGRNNGGWKVSRPFWTTVEQWLGEDPGALDARQGYAELVTAWLDRFGPGTEEDLVWWLGATKGAVRRALVDVGAVEVGLDGGLVGWVLPGDVEAVEPVEPWAALLPVLDPTTMGWKARDFYLGAHGSHVFDRNGNAGATAWVDGRIVGGWGQRVDGSVVVLPLEPLTGAQRRALDAEADRLTGWLDGEVVKSVYTAPHVRAWTAGG